MSSSNFHLIRAQLEPSSKLGENALLEQYTTLSTEVKSSSSEIQKLQMQAKLKYAIHEANFKLTGSHYPNPLTSVPDDSRYAWSNDRKWMYIEMKEVFTINLIRIRFYDKDKRIHTYQLGVSEDGLEWKSLSNGKQAQSIEVIKLPEPIEVRHIRISAYSNKDNHLHLHFLTVDWIW